MSVLFSSLGSQCVPGTRDTKTYLVSLDVLVNKGNNECFRKLSVCISGAGGKEKVAGENERQTLPIYQPLLFSFPSLRGRDISNLRQVSDPQTFSVK